jgi:hypothetical protein
MATAFSETGRTLSRPIDPQSRGYGAIYRPGQTNHCPGCGRTNWHIGTMTAECAFCATALPLEQSRPAAAPTFWTRS